MIKKILLSFAIFGFVFSSPILASAQSFTNLKTQLFDLGNKIENFKINNKAEVLGASSSDLPVVKLTISKHEVEYGESVTLSWSVENATKCSVPNTSTNSQWSGEKNPISGNQVITNIVAFHYFDLNCINDKGSAGDSKYVQVKSQKPIIYIQTTPEIIRPNESTTIKWKVVSPSGFTTTSCSPLAVNTNDAWLTPYSKNPVEGSQIINNILTTTTFGMFCKGTGGFSEIASATVRVEEKIPSILFSANPNEVLYLGSSLLSWKTENTTSCTASSDWTGIKSLTGTQIIAGIKNDKKFTITCIGYHPDLKVSKTVTVKVKKGDDPKDPNPDFPNDPKDGSGRIVNDTVKNTAPVNTCSTFTFKKNLSYGAKDSKSSRDVAFMQSVLVDEGLLSSKDATGVFYSKTQVALRNFQKRYSLSQTGKLDTKTADKLNSLFNQYCSQ